MMSLKLVKNLTEWTSLKRNVTPALIYTSRSFSEGKNANKTATQLTRLNAKQIKFTDENSKTITVAGPNNISPVTGIPEEHIKERLVRIYQTPKNAMQSGTDNVNHWELEFETRERWENPLMGWSSTGDPVSNLKLQFYDKESAINYAEKLGYNWYVEPERKGAPKVKSYGFNFSWNKRTRVSTK